MKYNRGINEVKSELTVNGPKDSFNENIEINHSLIANRIQNNLKTIDINIGKISNTKIKILYIKNITDNKLVKNIKNKLNKINIDAILDSSYLKNALEDNKNILPTIIETERPDRASMALLEGKVIILVDNSPYCLILPNLFFDFFHTPDDYYQKQFNTTFIRAIRIIAFIIAIFLPGAYIAITTRNYGIIPLNILLTFKAGRILVPFPAYIEAFLMIISFEILREGDIRMSNAAASSISILGGLILGDAAVAAGIVSPIMIIIIAISSISGIIFQSQELINAIKIYKLFNLLLSTLLGIYGTLICLIILVNNIINTKIFGYNYLDYDKYELLDTIIKYNTKIKRRNTKLTKNKIRGRYK